MQVDYSAIGWKFKQVSHEEGQSVQRPKRCECGSGDADNSLNNVNSLNNFNYFIAMWHQVEIVKFCYMEFV